MKIGIVPENADWIERLGPEIVDRMLVLQLRIMDQFGRDIEDRASDILDRTTRGTGMLALGIDHTVDLEGDSVVLETTWDERYGPVAEYGPEQESWEIEAKYAKALRFPILSSSGAVERVQYVARGYVIQFRWQEHMRRPHINPAVDALWNDVQDMLADTPALAAEQVG